MPLDKLCEWLEVNASYVFGGYTKNTWKFEAMHWEHEIREWMKSEGLNTNALLEQTKYRKEHVDRQSDPVCLAEDVPAIDTVPIKAISEWLAGYAAPPKYAIDEIAGTDPGRIVTTDTLVKAWEYHWKNLMECGLIGDLEETK